MTSREVGVEKTTSDTDSNAHVSPGAVKIHLVGAGSMASQHARKSSGRGMAAFKIVAQPFSILETPLLLHFDDLWSLLIASILPHTALHVYMKPLRIDFPSTFERWFTVYVIVHLPVVHTPYTNPADVAPDTLDSCFATAYNQSSVGQ